jgi:hypothetical protein
MTVLGYANKTQAALALKAQGKRYSEIGKMLGISPNAASGLISSANRQMHRNRQETAQPSPSIAKMLPMVLAGHARKRDLPLDRLILDIINTAANRGMIDGILQGWGDAA